MSNSPYKVGITGGIGSGKSLVCKIFSKLGAPVFDADSRARLIINENAQVKQKIIAVFGKAAYQNGSLDRQYIVSRVFNDNKKLNLLNNIVHPVVGEDFQLWSAEQNFKYVIKEAALMFESESYKQLNEVITISAPIELRIQRVLSRDRFRSKEEIDKIIEKQLSEDERTKRANYVIYNDEKSLLIPQVLNHHERLIKP